MVTGKKVIIVFILLFSYLRWDWEYNYIYINGRNVAGNAFIYYNGIQICGQGNGDELDINYSGTLSFTGQAFTQIEVIVQTSIDENPWN